MGSHIEIFARALKEQVLREIAEYFPVARKTLGLREFFDQELTEVQMFYFWLINTRSLNLKAYIGETVLLGFLDAANHHHENLNSDWAATERDAWLTALKPIRKDQEVLIDYWSGTAHFKSAEGVSLPDERLYICLFDRWIGQGWAGAWVDGWWCVCVCVRT